MKREVRWWEREYETVGGTEKNGKVLVCVPGGTDRSDLVSRKEGSERDSVVRQSNSVRLSKSK